MRIDPQTVEEVAKDLYIRALKILPPDVKRGFDALAARETAATAQNVLGTMIANIAVAESTDNLLCQDTGIPIYNVTIGRGVDVRTETTARRSRPRFAGAASARRASIRCARRSCIR